jgi:hypothetical protein
MKEKFLLVAMLLMLFSHYTWARIWRINNVPTVQADFSTAQEAHNAPITANGDTLYLEPSPTNYGDLTLTKRLTIISTGEFLTYHPNRQYMLTPGALDDVTFNSGSTGSVLHCKVLNNMSIAQSVNQIRIERCFLGGNITMGNAIKSNLFIRQCFISGSISIVSATDMVIENNIIGGRIFNGTEDAGSSGLIGNNVLNALSNSFTSALVNNFIFQNNIIAKSLAYSFANCTVRNNIAANGLFAAGNGNQNNLSMTTVFKNATGTIDKDFELQTSGFNPAKTNAFGGGDCGAYGGTSPYVSALQPAIPAIYKLVVPAAVSGDVLSIQFSSRANQ